MINPHDITPARRDEDDDIVDELQHHIDVIVQRREEKRQCTEEITDSVNQLIQLLKLSPNESIANGIFVQAHHSHDVAAKLRSTVFNVFADNLKKERE